MTRSIEQSETKLFVWNAWRQRLYITGVESSRWTFGIQSSRRRVCLLIETDSEMIWFSPLPLSPVDTEVHFSTRLNSFIMSRWKRSCFIHYNFYKRCFAENGTQNSVAFYILKPYVGQNCQSHYFDELN